MAAGAALALAMGHGAEAFQAPHSMVRAPSMGVAPHEAAASRHGPAAMIAKQTADEDKAWLADFGAHIAPNVPGAVPAANLALGTHPVGQAAIVGPFEFTLHGQEHVSNVYQVGTID